MYCTQLGVLLGHEIVQNRLLNLHTLSVSLEKLHFQLSYKMRCWWHSYKKQWLAGFAGIFLSLNYDVVDILNRWIITPTVKVFCTTTSSYSVSIINTFHASKKRSNFPYLHGSFRYTKIRQNNYVQKLTVPPLKQNQKRFERRSVVRDLQQNVRAECVYGYYEDT